MQKTFGRVWLYNFEEKVNFILLKKSFGANFRVRKNIGSIHSDEDYKTLDILLDVLINNYQTIQKSKVKHIGILINITYQKQANWNVSREQMNKLSFLNAVLCVTAYEASDE